MTDKITKVLVDPEWKWGNMEVGGMSIPYITLVHPDLGTITSVVPAPVVQQIIAGLTALVMTKQ